MDARCAALERMLEESGSGTNRLPLLESVLVRITTDEEAPMESPPPSPRPLLQPHGFEVRKLDESLIMYMRAQSDKADGREQVVVYPPGEWTDELIGYTSSLTWDVDDYPLISGQDFYYKRIFY